MSGSEQAAKDIVQEAAAHPQRVHWPSVLQVIFSSMAAMGLWVLALFFFLISLMESFGDGADLSAGTVTFLSAAGFGLIGSFALLSAVFALLRIIGQPIEDHSWMRKLQRLRPPYIILFFPFIWVVGVLAAGDARIALLILPAMHLMGVSLPIFWLVWVGARNLPSGSLQRKWGLFASGSIISPAIVLIPEGIAAVFLGVLALIIKPGLMVELNRMSVGRSIGLNDSEMYERIVSEYIVQPEILLIVLALFSVVVPLIEELFKTIGVWFLAGKNLKPVEGYTAGLISGAGFALAETLFAGSTPEDWGLFVLVRIGAGLVHIFTGGLIGWGLALAWSEKRYLHLASAFLLAVVFHGLWNAASVLMGVSILPVDPQGGWNLPVYLVIIGPIFLLFSSLAAFFFLVYSNRRLSASLDTPSLASAEAVEQV